MRKYFSILIAAVLLCTFAGAAADPIQVTMLKSAGGNDTNIELWRHLVEEFEEWTDGKYTLALEEIPGVAVDVRTKLKMLNAANHLPALVSDLSAEPAFADLLISNDRLLDMSEAFAADEQWKSTAFETSIAFNTSEDGAMYTSPAVYTQYVGIFYNKELLAQVGYETFPETWEEFWDLCNKLKEAGIAALSLHTTETGWCPMLLATAYAATASEEGAAFLRENFPSDFNNDAMVDMITMLRKLFDYTTSDAIGGTYSLAANNFCTGKTAMIANGPWMIDSLYDTQYSPEGFAEKVGYATFPEHLMLCDEGEVYGYGISKDVSEEEQAGAIEFLKFLALPEVISEFTVTMGSMSNLVELTQETLDQLSPMMQEYADAVSQTTVTAPRYQAKWDSVVQTEVIEQELPNLVQDIITPEEFVTKMTEGAQRYLSETAGQ